MNLQEYMVGLLSLPEQSHLATDLRCFKCVPIYQIGIKGVGEDDRALDTVPIYVFCFVLTCQ